MGLVRPSIHAFAPAHVLRQPQIDVDNDSKAASPLTTNVCTPCINHHVYIYLSVKPYAS